jgi:hypothetical protein
MRPSFFRVHLAQKRLIRLKAHRQVRDKKPSDRSRPVADIAGGRYAVRVENEALASFEGPTGSLRIGVERYQFPEITDDEWNSNWLIITGEAVLEDKSWSFRDPCLTTFERSLTIGSSKSGVHHARRNISLTSSLTGRC